MSNRVPQAPRQATVERRTKETDLAVSIDLDQPGRLEFSLGLPFLEHMLHAMAFHGGFSLSVKGTGDLAVDPHHLVEDCGLVIGMALAKALGNTPVARYGNALIPMDDALSEAVVDLCKRPYLVYRAQYPQERSGTFDMFLFKEFFQALANKGEFNLHLHCRYGDNAHHMVEALFKALGKALYQASRPIEGPAPSTKGSL